VGRRALTMRNVAVAALIIILSDPVSVFRPSFQLSFAAVVALIGAWELTRGREGRERSLPMQVVAYFSGSAVTSLVAGAATLLFSIYHFQQTSPLGVIGNLISLPLVGFVMMPAAVAAVLMMPLGFEGPFLKAMGWSIDRMLDVARLVAGMSGGLNASPLLTPVALFVGVVALAWFVFFPNRWRLLGPLLAVPAVALFALDTPPDILISDTTQALAMRFDDGMRLVDGKPGSFAVGVWEETYGGTIGARTGDDLVGCDSIGCIATSPAGFTLSLVEDPAGFYEDCSDADVVVTHRTAPKACHAPLVIDAAALRIGGVQWLRWTGTAFEVRPAIVDPDRAWRVSP
jgi:competence protein ComEC